MKVRDILAGVCVALALVGSPAVTSVARAAGETEVQPPNTEVFISFGEKHGYEVSIFMPNPRVVVLYAFKVGEKPSPLYYMQSAYAVRAPVGALERGVIRAPFPSLGSVSLRFDPSGERRVHRAQNDCRGRRRVTESGTFRGSVSFEGEGGYLNLDARSGSGVLERSFRLVCGKGEAKQMDVGAPLWEYAVPVLGFSYSPGRGTVALLNGLAREGCRSIGIRAAHYEGEPPGAEVQLGVLEQRPGMAIGRFAYVQGGFPGTLTTSSPGVHPASATLAPPAPFHGEASYFENSATSHSWTGTLGVSLPGLDLSLVGEQFKTSLCVVSPLKTPAGCDFTKPKPLRGARIGMPRVWMRP